MELDKVGVRRQPQRIEGSALVICEGGINHTIELKSMWSAHLVDGGIDQSNMLDAILGGIDGIIARLKGLGPGRIWRGSDVFDMIHVVQDDVEVFARRADTDQVEFRLRCFYGFLPDPKPTHNEWGEISP